MEERREKGRGGGRKQGRERGGWGEEGDREGGGREGGEGREREEDGGRKEVGSPYVVTYMYSNMYLHCRPSQSF